MKQEHFENYDIQIGRSAAENTALVSAAKGTDIWFHVHQAPSCHVILKNDAKIHAIPHKVIKRCAYLCKVNSKERPKERANDLANPKECNSCEIVYAYISNVTPTDIPGQVHIGDHKLIRI
jgi:predicted ribosome quality control (RQC) complex YloA/Tae2 family protein